MMHRVAAILVLPLGLIPVAVAATLSPWDNVPAKQHQRRNPVADQPEAIEAGAEIYREHCQQCHQADGRGDDRHPSLLSNHVRNAADGDLEWYLRQGDRAHGMPSWAALTQRQRWQLVSYLKSLK